MEEEGYLYEYEEGYDRAYCYPGSRVLKNKLGIRDIEELEKTERRMAMVKAVFINDRITGNFDLEHLKSIHCFLFEDIYEWAGSLREVDIAKGSMFCRKEFIVPQFSLVYEDLRKDNFLKGCSDREYVYRKLSYYLSEINAIHPFREGNGRAQRIYLQQLSRNTGCFYLDFSLASMEEMIQASQESFLGKRKRMDGLIDRCLKSI